MLGEIRPQNSRLDIFSARILVGSFFDVWYEGAKRPVTKSSEGPRASELPLLRRLPLSRPCTRAPTRGHGRGRHTRRGGSHQGRDRRASTRVALCRFPNHPHRWAGYRSTRRLSVLLNLPRIPPRRRPYLPATFQRYDPACFEVPAEEPTRLTVGWIEWW